VQCCSGTACAAAERQFGPEVAWRDIQRYHRKGPDAATRALLSGIRAVMPTGGSLLDVGGGVGVVTFELLADGFGPATLVDGSPSYVKAASVEAERLGHSSRLHFVVGDFTGIATKIEPADVVTMHRVICCYPDWTALLGKATQLSGRLLAFSYPRDEWYVRSWVRLDSLRRRLFGNTFRTFVHSAVAMDDCIVSAGFDRITRQQTPFWCVDVYATRRSV